MNACDPRLRLTLEGTAAAALEGVYPARTYRRTERRGGAAGRTGVRKTSDPAAEQVSELLFGEAFEVLEDRGDAAFGQCARDGQVGWVAATSLGAWREPTHRVRALATLVFTEQSIKSPPLRRLPMNALVRARERRASFLLLEDGGFVPEGHLASLGAFEASPIGVATRFLGVPYLWGGRTADGLDCSGLVQAAFFASGRGCPRDSDQQRELGVPIDPGKECEALRPGDLVFWEGHVGMVLDPERLIHANASAMCVAIEDLGAARRRIAESGGGAVIAVRRP